MDHDFHPEGYSFGSRREENAWIKHSQTPSAPRASPRTEETTARKCGAKLQREVLYEALTNPNFVATTSIHQPPLSGLFVSRSRVPAFEFLLDFSAAQDQNSCRNRLSERAIPTEGAGKRTLPEANGNSLCW
jgi:hypothetical protein